MCRIESESGPEQELWNDQEDWLDGETLVGRLHAQLAWMG